MNVVVQSRLIRPEHLLNFNGRSELPVIIQSETSECGLACLAMVAGYHGFETDMTSLRRKFSVSSHGTDLKNLMAMASSLGLSPRALRADVDDMSSVELPCILHWNFNHFVVLKSIKNDRFVIHDPAVGQRSVDRTAFGNQFTGIVLEIIPTKEFKKGADVQRISLSDFWSTIRGLKRSLLHVILLSFLLQIFSLASPFFIQTVVDDVLLRKDTNLLVVLALGFGLLNLVQTGTTALRSLVILRLSNSFGMQMSANLFRHLIRLPMFYFSKRHMGDIVSRFDSLNNIRNVITDGLIAAVVDGVMTIFTLAAMFLYDFHLALVAVAIVTLYGCARWAIYRPLKLLTEENIIASAKEKSHFMESVRAIQTIKLFQREPDRQSQWLNRLALVLNTKIRLGNWTIGYSAINGVLFGIGNIVIIYFAATSVMNNIMSIGMLYAFLSYQGRFTSSVDSLINQFIQFKMLSVHLGRLSDIIFTTPEETDVHEALSKTTSENRASSPNIKFEKNHSIVGKIEVKNISFRYGDGESYIFKDLSFLIHPGETFAIIGASGCGKTTLLKCLMGLLEPTEGEIYIDDKPLKKTINYRAQIAAVMQEDQLLAGDIAENIACFDSTIDLEKVYECARMACIHDEIERMPMSYRTLVGDMGSGLSGGQKQRVILARAFYKEPRILFMDEATSHLDVHNESMVNDYVKHLDFTRVIVAHRPETVRLARRTIDLTTQIGA